MASQTPGYDYENRMDTPVKLRLELDYGHDYKLLFHAESKDEFPGILPFAWHTVRKYVRTPSRRYKPGDGCPDREFGNWIHRSFHVDTEDDGRNLLESLRGKIRTAGDIYRMFIEDGVKQQYDDMQRYREYQEKLKDLPRKID